MSATTIQLDEPQEAQLADRDSLALVIDGIIMGSPATSVIWRRNGSMITTSDHFHVGGGEKFPYDDRTYCYDRKYRVALAVFGYQPGNYTYTVDNDITPTPVTSPVFQIKGIYKSIK